MLEFDPGRQVWQETHLLQETLKVVGLGFRGLGFRDVNTRYSLSS